MARARYRAVVDRFESSRPGSPAAYEVVVLRDVIPVAGGALTGEQRLAHVGVMQRLDLTAGNLIEFAARCDAYDSDGRCIGSDITDPGDFAAAGEQGDAAIPVGITFRLSYPGRPVKLAHRV